MRSILMAAVLGLAVVGCANANATGEPTEGTGTASNELGLNVTTLSDGTVSGTMVTSAGTVKFNTIKTAEGVFRVEFDRGRGTFGATVDRNTLSADLFGPDKYQVDDADQFVMTALASALAEGIGQETPIRDNLLRTANLWAEYPVGKLTARHIQADPERSVTTLCSTANANPPNSRQFYESGYGTDYATCRNGSHKSTKAYTYSTAYGKYAARCVSRCGPGCTSVGTSAWTVDCGNHDMCEYYHTSECVYDPYNGYTCINWCDDEFTSASDDYLFGNNCSY